MKILLFLLTLFLCCCKSDPSTEQTETVTHTDTLVERKDIDITHAYKWLQSDHPPVLIDVRTPSEYTDGHIAGAKMIDYKDDSFKSEIVKLDKNATYLLYCRSGNRSGKATDYMISQGFRDVTNMEGGYLEWSDAY